MDLAARKIIFAESLRVFRSIFKIALVYSLVLSTLFISSFVFDELHSSGVIFLGESENVAILKSVFWFLVSWFMIFSWVIFTFIAYRLHFELQKIDRKQEISQYLNFLVAMIVFNTLCDRFIFWILSPLPELTLLEKFWLIDNDWFFVIGVSVDWLFVTILLCIFGSWFPALLTKKDISVLATVQRGFRQFFWTFGQFLLGPGLFVLLAVVATGLFKVLSGIEIGTDLDPLWPLAILVIGLGAFAILMLIILSVLFCNTLGAIILSQSLLRDEQTAAIRAEIGTVPGGETRFSFNWKGA